MGKWAYDLWGEQDHTEVITRSTFPSANDYLIRNKAEKFQSANYYNWNVSFEHYQELVCVQY